MNSETDISDTILAKSDQLSSDELLGGPITVTVVSVKRAEADQPLAVAISGGHKDYFPCKTCRRILIAGWGKDATKWIGKSLKLFRDPGVKWGGEVVGGIRIQAMSDIPNKLEIALAETRHKKKLVTVEKLGDSKPAPTKPAAPPTDARSKLQKYADWLPSRTPEQIVGDYKKFDLEVASTLSESEAQAIYAEFSKYAPQISQQDEP